MKGVNVSSYPEVLGNPIKISTTILEAGTSTIQAFGPINMIHQHLCFLIYGRPDEDGCLIDLEYIISKNYFLLCQRWRSLFSTATNMRNVENRFGVSISSERENRAYMKGPESGIHPLANAARKGLQPVLREFDCKPVESVPRVFV
ncbi:hypothetical protein M9H77_11272 [Catharanthus roseus]|uniref:Uncharacterized protein n=2 Tax=Catharanthus roseus TaxID=4058 RepID=A0ACC0BE60_CATRO|nr:hypothetical protein M9H77_30305 [Catharanthus roseus]KAI5670908.1 hypothetical protein M9H77_11272 [Catharanthus roseus]